MCSSFPGALERILDLKLRCDQCPLLLFPLFFSPPAAAPAVRFLHVSIPDVSPSSCRVSHKEDTAKNFQQLYRDLCFPLPCLWWISGCAVRSSWLLHVPYFFPQPCESGFARDEQQILCWCIKAALNI